MFNKKKTNAKMEEKARAALENIAGKIKSKIEDDVIDKLGQMIEFASELTGKTLITLSGDEYDISISLIPKNEENHK